MYVCVCACVCVRVCVCVCVKDERERGGSERVHLNGNCNRLSVLRHHYQSSTIRGSMPPEATSI